MSKTLGEYTIPELQAEIRRQKAAARRMTLTREIRAQATREILDRYGDVGHDRRGRVAYPGGGMDWATARLRTLAIDAHKVGRPPTRATLDAVARGLFHTLALFRMERLEGEAAAAVFPKVNPYFHGGGSWGAWEMGHRRALMSATGKAEPLTPQATL